MAPPAPGQIFGPYELVALIGAGGMGEVWRARDTRLDRSVAMKFSKVPFSQRFEREARAVAALNHPHICTLHDVGPNYLVMEYLDGKPPSGPLPLAKAIEYAGQILDALDAAHRQGIAHRDLKPQNILVTRQGVKLLDFGLAKMAPAKTTDGDETAAMGITQANTILGTPQYMAPEQIEGKPTDERTDIFAFGLLFYEMLSGSKAFEGKSTPQLLAALLTAEPPSLRDLAPPAVDGVLRRALAKDPEQRWQSARDLKMALELAREPAAPAVLARRIPWLPWTALAAGLLTVVGAAAMWRTRNGDAAPARFQLSILPPEGSPLPPVGRQGSEPEISPDGTAVVFQAGGKVWIRRLDALQAQPLPDLPSAMYSAFWSPDGKSLGFITGLPAAGITRINPADGARQQILAITSPTRGASWNRNGAILLSQGAGLQSVSAAGGKPVPLLDAHCYFPRFLPNGEDFVFGSPQRPQRESDLKPGIYLATLRGGKLAGSPVLLRQDAVGARYLEAGGSVLFVAGDDLYRQKLDLTQRRLTGDAKLVMHGVASAPVQGLADYSVSSNGIVAWRPGKAPAVRLTWFDRSGRELGTLGPEMDEAGAVRCSPDGRHVLVQRSLFDTTTGEQVKLDFPGFFAWSPDGSAILVPGSGGNTIEEHPLASLSEVRAVRRTPQLDRDGWFDVAADGTLLYENDNGDSFYVLRPGASAPQAMRFSLPSGEHAIGSASLSADGRWLVYSTNSGVYVQAAAPGTLRQQISAAGVDAHWREDGKEIVFWRDAKIWSVRVEAQGTRMTVSPPEPLFAYSRPAGSVTKSQLIAIARDGSRILVPQEIPQPEPTNVIHVMTLPR